MRRIAHLLTVTLVVLAPVALASGGCASFPRRLEYATMRSPALDGTYAQYAVYQPSEIGEGERLPLVVFLHGGGDGPDALDRHGVAARLDTAMRAGEVPRAVIVVPEGHLGFWANWYDGSRRYEDWVVDEVMPKVARDYRTAACPEGCHLMGVSMGAEGALRIAMHRPGTFASVASISGPSMDTDRRIAFSQNPLINAIIPTHHVFGPTEPRSRVEADDPFVQWQTAEDLAGMRVVLAWGTRDRGEIREGSAALDRVMTERGIPHVAHEFEGEHGWRDWGAAIEEVLRAQLAR